MQLSYHWLIVAVGDLMTCVGIGAMLGVAGSGRGADEWIFDIFNGYGRLGWGSFAVGLGAAAVARGVPPLPRQQLQPA